MAAAAILKNQKSAISPERFDWASEPDRELKFPTFENPRWRTAAILKNRHISAAV